MFYNVQNKLKDTCIRTRNALKAKQAIEYVTFAAVNDYNNRYIITNTKYQHTLT